MYALVEVETTSIKPDGHAQGTGTTRYACVVMCTDDDVDAEPPTLDDLDDLIQFGVTYVGAQGGGAFVMPLPAQTEASS